MAERKYRGKPKGAKITPEPKAKIYKYGAEPGTPLKTETYTGHKAVMDAARKVYGSQMTRKEYEQLKKK